jgi:uncharacterized protein (TIGR02284 family)
MAVSEKLVATLNDLLMLDHDAVDAYQQAIDALKSTACRARLQEFQGDHRRHIDDLSDCIRRLGGSPKSRRDVKGFFIKGMTMVQAALGDEPALKAMQTNEKLTNRQYADALGDQGMPDDVRTLVAKNREDERRHLEWLNQALAQRLWTQQPGAYP